VADPIRLCPHCEQPTTDPWIADRDGACSACHEERCAEIDARREALEAEQEAA
jgi:hypothetical protein